MLLGFPAAHVGANLGYELERSVRTDRVDLAQIGATGEPMQRGADVKAGLAIFGLTRTPHGRECGLGLRPLCGENRQQRFDLGVAFIHQLKCKSWNLF